MFWIYTLNTDVTVAYAAQELKKYLRMMMPHLSNIEISYNPRASDGFRLGLMSDFGIKTEVVDSFLDDEIYVETEKDGGIISGNNPRSVLFAVYRYLKANGCLWLFPGPEGEKIPTIDNLLSVKYRHKPSYRYRGQCDEGTHTIRQMLDAIEFTPKLGLNTFMIEGDVPAYFYDQAAITNNCDGKINNEQLLQWRRACEDEIKKRGLMYHAYGHGFTAYPYGFENLSEMGLNKQELDEEYKKDKYRHAALVNGKRRLFADCHLKTNVCMSNFETRTLLVKYVVDYAKNHSNIDFLHIWLGDATNGHCECGECVKKSPSDWYIILLNEIDTCLTQNNLSTRLVFISYLDTVWAPDTERLNNPDRFKFLFAPIDRIYTCSYKDDADTENLVPYERNKLVLPKNMSEALGYLQKWRKVFDGDCFCYEYYFWLQYIFDMGTRLLAKTIYSDVQGLKKHGLCGIVEDGTQRAFFPNGFQFYVYCETMFDTSISFKQLELEYYSTAYGKDWQKVKDYFEKIENTTDYLYLSGNKKKDKDSTRFYNPDMAEGLLKIPQIVDEFMPVIKSHTDCDSLIENISWDLLKWHGEFIKLYSKAMALKAVDEQQKAYEVFEHILEVMKPLELYRGNCFDYQSIKYALRYVFKIR